MNQDLFNIHAKMDKHTPADIICRLSYQGSSRYRQPATYSVDPRNMMPDNIAACKCGALFRVPDAMLDPALHIVQEKSRLLASPYYLGAMLDQHPEWASTLFYQLLYLDHQGYDPKLTYCMRNIIAFLSEGSGLKPHQIHLVACHYLGSPYILRYGRDPLYTSQDEYIQRNLVSMLQRHPKLGPEDILPDFLDPTRQTVTGISQLRDQYLTAAQIQEWIKPIDLAGYYVAAPLDIMNPALGRLLSDEMADGLSA